MTRVSVLICTRDRPHALERCLHSVLANDYEDFDVTVVDQSAGDETEDVVCPVDDTRLGYLRVRSIGLSAARNAGVGRAGGEILAFTDDDCVVSATWVRRIAEVFFRDEDVGLVFGAFLPAPHDHREFFVPSFIPTHYRRLKGLWATRRNDSEAGGNMAVRRAVFDAVGPFDPCLSTGGTLFSGDDSDYAFRTLHAGFAVAHDPECVVIHWGLRAYADGSARRLLLDGSVARGALLAKELRCGNPVAVYIGAQLLVQRLIGIVGAILTKRRSSGARQLIHLALGFRRGFLHPLDRQAQLFLEPCGAPGCPVDQRPITVDRPDRTAASIPQDSMLIDRIDVPRITIVVPTRNRPRLIRDAISALQRLEYPDYRVFVVDQSTDDRTKAVVAGVAREDTRIEYCSTITVGSSAGRNLGALLSDTDIIAYTDDDCIVTSGWLTAMAREFQDPAVVAVYGRLLPYERGRRTGIEVGYMDGVERRIYRRRPVSLNVGHGANMSFRRHTLLSVGGFDPLLSAGGLLQSNEDQDIAHRLLARGDHVVYCPEALAYHRNWKPWPEQKAMEHAYGIGAGSQFSKYVRCGDFLGIPLFFMWIWKLGVRRILAGLLKWRSRRVMYLGLCQLVYPWIGLAHSLRYDIDRDTVIYVPPESDAIAALRAGIEHRVVH